ncbi:MAG: iron ABC transporter permease [Solobacterium sp.]|nr:iron ABC transporter permease [Solobacterium sp.]
MILSIMNGAAKISIDTIMNALFRYDPTDSAQVVIMKLRLPRIILSLLVGTSFAVAGSIMQGITQNPLADSGLLGLNAGAGFAVSICFAFFPGLHYAGLAFWSFIGAACSSLLVSRIARSGFDVITPSRMVLAGAAVNALLSSLSKGIALYYHVGQDILFWTVGGTAGTDWQQVFIMIPITLIAVLFAVMLSGSITVLSMGDETAASLGLNVQRTRLFCSMIVMLLAGSSVAVVGSVSFVGLIVPHIVRYFVGSDYRYVVPVSAVFGAILFLLADFGARMIHPPFETPVGSVIALIGVPFFLYLARKGDR